LGQDFIADCNMFPTVTITTCTTKT